MAQIKNADPTIPSPAPTKRRNKDLSKKKLLKAGLEVFSKCGFEAATSKQIAKRAGINEALIARYFKGKAGLLNAVILESAAETKEKMNSHPAGASLEEEIFSILKGQYEECRGKRDFFRIAISRLMVDLKLSSIVEEKILSKDEALIGRLKRFQETGEIAKDRDLSVLARIIQFESMGILLMTIIQRRCDEAEVDAVIRNVSPMLAYGFMQPLKK